MQGLLTALLLHVDKLHLARSLGVHVQTTGIFCAATAFADMLAASADTTLAGAEMNSKASGASGFGVAGAYQQTAAGGHGGSSPEQGMIGALHAMGLSSAGQG